MTACANKRCSIGWNPSSSQYSMMLASDIGEGGQQRMHYQDLEGDSKRVGVDRRCGPPRFFGSCSCTCTLYRKISRRVRGTDSCSKRTRTKSTKSWISLLAFYHWKR